MVQPHLTVLKCYSCLIRRRTSGTTCSARNRIQIHLALNTSQHLVFFFSFLKKLNFSWNNDTGIFLLNISILFPTPENLPKISFWSCGAQLAMLKDYSCISLTVLRGLYGMPGIKSRSLAYKLHVRQVQTLLQYCSGPFLNIFKS